MKKVILFSMLLIMSASSFSQQTTSNATSLIKQDYLQKSKKQNKTGLILLGSGSTLFVAGIIAYQKGPGGLILMGLGLLTDVISLPFIVASSKNKKKAMSLSFKNETAPQLLKGSFVNRPVPSLALKINL